MSVALGRVIADRDIEANALWIIRRDVDQAVRPLLEINCERDGSRRFTALALAQLHCSALQDGFGGRGLYTDGDHGQGVAPEENESRCSRSATPRSTSPSCRRPNTTPKNGWPRWGGAPEGLPHDRHF